MQNLQYAAAALAEDPLLEAELLEHAGRLAIRANRPLEARERLERALALYADAGNERAAARASAALADVDLFEGRAEEAAERLEQAVAQLEQGKPSGELAIALAQLGRTRALAGHGEDAAAPLELALTLAERLQLPEVFVEALTSKAVLLMNQARLIEGRIVLEAAAAHARAEQVYASSFRAENNLAMVLEISDRYAEALEVIEGALALARRRGDRHWESSLRTASLIGLFLLGRWDEALGIAAEEEPQIADETSRGELLAVALIHCERGELEPARGLLSSADTLRNSDIPAMRAAYAAVEARLLRSEGRYAKAVAAAERALATLRGLAITHTVIKLAWVEATEAALALPELDKADELLAIPRSLDPGELTPFLQANTERLQARLDAARGNHDGIEEHFRTAAALSREFGLAFHLAVTQFEHAEWLTGQGRTDEAQPLLTDARQAFEQLQATPWLQRTAHVTPSRREPEAAIS